MNSVNLIGRIATVPVRLADTSKGNKRVAFRIAIERIGKNTADFLWVTCWNGTADAVMQYRTKGDEVAVEGSLNANRKERDDGFKYDAVEVSASRIHFLRHKNVPNDTPADVGAEDAATEGADLVGAATAQGDDIPF